MLNTSGSFKIITISYDECDVHGCSGAIYKPHRLVTDIHIDRVEINYYNHIRNMLLHNMEER